MIRMNNTFRMAYENLRGPKATDRAKKYADQWREAETAAKKAQEDVEATQLDRIENAMACILIDMNRRTAYEEETGLAITSLYDKLEEQEKQISILTAMIERLLPDVDFGCAPVATEAEGFMSFEEVFANYAKVGRNAAVVITKKGVKEEVVEAKVVEAVAPTGKKRGPKPKRYKEALALLETSVTPKGRYRWSPELVIAFITKFSYENPDNNMTVTEIMETECWGAYLYAQRNDDLRGTWSKLVQQNKF